MAILAVYTWYTREIHRSTAKQLKHAGDQLLEFKEQREFERDVARAPMRFVPAFVHFDKQSAKRWLLSFKNAGSIVTFDRLDATGYVVTPAQPFVRGAYPWGPGVEHAFFVDATESESAGSPVRCELIYRTLIREIEHCRFTASESGIDNVSYGIESTRTIEDH
jgi:hypothetical protein